MARFKATDIFRLSYALTRTTVQWFINCCYAGGPGRQNTTDRRPGTQTGCLLHHSCLTMQLHNCTRTQYTKMHFLEAGMSPFLHSSSRPSYCTMLQANTPIGPHQVIVLNDHALPGNMTHPRDGPTQGRAHLRFT